MNNCFYRITVHNFFKHNPKDRKCYVYFISKRWMGDANFLIKIGHSYNPKLRLQKIKCVDQCEAFLLFQLELNSKKEAYVREKEFHKQFNKSHDFGEYFKINDSLLSFLKSNGVPDEKIYL